MGLFDFMKGKKGIEIASPVKGECIPLKDVADPTFAEEILGKGMAVKPADGRIVAPADGTITTMFPTGHAVGLATADGVELLVHVGLDTVALKGQCFEKHVTEGQQVKKGDLLITVDLEGIKAAGYDTVTPVIVCNSADYTSMECKNEGNVEAGDKVITCVK